MQGETQERESGPQYFSTTQWTLVVEAGDPNHSDVAKALASLCETYWFPLYAYARKIGNKEEEAKDLTQGFFVKLLEKNYLGKANRNRGRFRWFLLSSFKNFIHNEWERQTAQKRGGRDQPISWDQVSAEARYHMEPADDQSPDLVFEKRWALTLIANSRKKLGEQFDAANKRDRFEALEPHLLGGGDRYVDIAAKLGTTEGALKQEVRRMRDRFRELLRSEVAQTVASVDEVDNEISYLMDVLAK